MLWLVCLEITSECYNVKQSVIICPNFLRQKAKPEVSSINSLIMTQIKIVLYIAKKELIVNI